MLGCRTIQTKLWLILLFVAGLVVSSETIFARPQIFVPDPIAGYAIGGHDPVAYFVDRKPRKGLARYEYEWGGARWIFVNQGNQSAFEKAPDTYAPVFAGCAVHSLAEGFASAGNPYIFAIYDQKLLFFHSVVNRFLFLVNPEPQMKDAEATAHKTGCTPRK